MSLLEPPGETQPLASVPEPDEKEDTEYVVLKLREDLGSESSSPGEAAARNELWEKIGSGRGSRAVVLKAIVGQTDGVFCVTPARSWKPARVEVETTVKVTEL